MPQLIRFDWAMKYLLRNKANFDILEGFLSELLKTQVKIEQILESESNKNHAEDKFNRVDLLVKITGKKYVIIELQCSSQWDYLSRILYGASKMVCEYLREGDGYGNICKVISISIVFFDLGEGKDYLYKGTTHFKGVHYHDTLDLNAKEREAYCQPNGLNLETPEMIFPEYYIIKVTRFQEKVQDKIDEWIYFLKNGKIEKNFSAQGLQSANEKLAVLHLSAEDRRAYERYQESLHDDGSLSHMLAVSKRVGHKEGLEKGLELGEKKMQLQIAQSLKQAGLSDEQIAAHTHLPLEEIKKISQ